MNLQQILYALEVAATGNFSKAAENLHITEPTISQQIRKLENELHVALFSRSTRRVVLTEAGEIFVREAKPIARGYLSLQASMRQLSRESSKSLSIGMSSRSYALGLPRFFREYGQLHSDLNITLRTIPFSQINAELLKGDCDFAILKMMPAMLRQIETEFFRYEILFRETMHVLVTKGLFPEEKSSLTLPEIADMPVTFDSTDFRFRQIIQDFYRKAGYQLKPAPLHTNDMEAMLFAVEQGDAITFASTSSASHYKSRYRYHAIPFSPPIVSSVVLLYRRDMKLTENDRSFMQALGMWLKANLK